MYQWKLQLLLNVLPKNVRLSGPPNLLLRICSALGIWFGKSLIIVNISTNDERRQ